MGVCTGMQVFWGASGFGSLGTGVSVVLSHQMWVLGTKLWSAAVVTTLSFNIREAALQPAGCLGEGRPLLNVGGTCHELGLGLNKERRKCAVTSIYLCFLTADAV